MKLSESKAPLILKALMLGDSGSGKTAALASLARAGYKIRMHDYDNGHHILLDEKILEAKYRDNIDVLVLTDKFSTTRQGLVMPRTPTAFSDAMKSLDNWPGEEKVGGIRDWDDSTVFVVDSLTLMNNAILRQTIYQNNRVGMPVRISDWGDAVAREEEFINMIFQDEVKCHVILNCHIRFLQVPGGEEDDIRAYPMAMGQQLPQKIASYFNNVFHCTVRNLTSRLMYTQSLGLFELKSAKPSIIQRQYPLEEGWAQIFRAVTGKPGPGVEAQQSKDSK